MTAPCRHRRAAAVGAAVLLLVTVACGGRAPSAGGPPPLTVAAASDLRPAFEELGAAYTAATGIRVSFSFGSSGQLKEQVLNGAPFDLFASADEAFVDEVVDAGRGDPATRAAYAVGRLALTTADGLDVPSGVDALGDAGTYRRIAIANPAHAPYGAAAEQALESAGVLDEVAPRLVYGQNVSDALRLVESGNADAGVVALSLALASGRPHRPVPGALHDPLRQALVVTTTGPSGAAARGFAALVRSEDGREVLARHGFALPDGDGAEER